jgi:hypothetical protein
MISNYKEFLDSLKTEDNKIIIESIIFGYLSLFESLSTDDANAKPFGSVLKYEEPATLLPGNPEKEDEEYFSKTLSDDKLELVRRSKFGLGRIAKYPPPGRGIASNDPQTNQYGAIQNTDGGIKETSSN